MDVGQFCPAASFQANVFPDADGRQLGTPVPAKLAGRLAQVRPAVDGLADAAQRALGLGRPHELDGGAEADRQLVFTGSQAIFDLPPILAKHVVGAAQRLAIQGQVGQRIQPVADQEDLGLGQHGCVRGEAQLIFPVAFGHPHDLFFVVAHEGVGDALQGQQVGMHAAGNLGGQPFGGCGLAKLPAAGKRLKVHRCCLSI